MKSKVTWSYAFNFATSLSNFQVVPPLRFRLVLLSEISCLSLSNKEAPTQALRNCDLVGLRFHARPVLIDFFDYLLLLGAVFGARGVFPI